MNVLEATYNFLDDRYVLVTDKNNYDIIDILDNYFIRHIMVNNEHYLYDVDHFQGIYTEVNSILELEKKVELYIKAQNRNKIIEEIMNKG